MLILVSTPNDIADSFGTASFGSKLVFQTGLRYSAPTPDTVFPTLGEPKPSYAAYKVPLFVVDGGRTLTVWGGVRGVNSGRVQILNGSRTVKTVRLGRGYFTTTIKKRKGTWRLSYTAGGVTIRSRVAKPVKPGR